MASTDTTTKIDEESVENIAESKRLVVNPVTLTKTFSPTATREEMASALVDKGHVLAYDTHDASRIMGATSFFVGKSVNLINALGAFRDEIGTEADEDSESRMRYARQELVEAWAAAQTELSSLAVIFRINGPVAYRRYVNALVEDEAIDMRGL